MIKFSIELNNSLGLHARSAAVLVKTIMNFKSEVFINYKSSTIDGRSLMDIISLSALKGAKLEFAVEGIDEAECSEAIKEIIQNNFGEDN